jgi:hypothetical protein
MKRRQFVIALGAGIALWTARSHGAWARLRRGPHPDAAERLLSAVARPKNAAVVGRRYLAGHPQEADRRWLAGELGADLRRQGCDPRRTDAAGLRAGLARQVRADFACSRVVRVDGWVLSVTEARLCALAALTAA